MYLVSYSSAIINCRKTVYCLPSAGHKCQLSCSRGFTLCVCYSIYSSSLNHVCRMAFMHLSASIAF